MSASPEGIEPVDLGLEFVEEPLGVTAEQGHGFPWIEFGEVMGPALQGLTNVWWQNIENIIGCSETKFDQ